MNFQVDPTTVERCFWTTSDWGLIFECALKSNLLRLVQGTSVFLPSQKDLQE